MRKPHRHKTHKVHKREVPHRKVPFRGVDNTKDIDMILASEKLMQDVLGFSGDKLGNLFETAVSYLRQHRYEEAVQGFQLLTQLNPYIADFWLGLGLAEQAQGALPKALSNFLVAETMDPLRIDPYSYAIDICLEMNNIPQAEAIIDQGTRYAKKYGKQEEGRILMNALKTLKERVESEKR